MERDELLKRRAMLEKHRNEQTKSQSEDWKDAKYWKRCYDLQLETFNQIYPNYGLEIFDDYFDHMKNGRIKNMKEYAELHDLERKKEVKLKLIQ